MGVLSNVTRVVCDYIAMNSIGISRRKMKCLEKLMHRRYRGETNH